MGSDNGPAAKKFVSFERILLLAFLITVFALTVSKNEPEVHHHYYDSMGEGQAHHHYGEIVVSKSSSVKKDSTGLRGPLGDALKYTLSPTSDGSSGGSSTKPPEDWEKDTPSGSEDHEFPEQSSPSYSESEDENSTSAPENSELPEQGTANGSESEDESSTSAPENSELPEQGTANGSEDEDEDESDSSD